MTLRSEYTPQARKCNDSPDPAGGCVGLAPFATVPRRRIGACGSTADQSRNEVAKMEATVSVHPARRAGQNSMRNVKAKDKTAWLALFADDAVIEDPVGVSPLDPSGQGHRGKDAIARFWDTVIAPGDVDMRVRESYASGNECANVVSLVNRMPGGVEIGTDCVIVYRVDEGGRIVSLRAYWEFEKVAAQLAAALGKASPG
jgi:steroid delta-isomerase